MLRPVAAFVFSSVALLAQARSVDPPHCVASSVARAAVDPPLW